MSGIDLSDPAQSAAEIQKSLNLLDSISAAAAAGGAAGEGGGEGLLSVPPGFDPTATDYTRCGHNRRSVFSSFFLSRFLLIQIDYHFAKTGSGRKHSENKLRSSKNGIMIVCVVFSCLILCNRIFEADFDEGAYKAAQEAEAAQVERLAQLEAEEWAAKNVRHRMERHAAPLPQRIPGANTSGVMLASKHSSSSSSSSSSSMRQLCRW